MTAMTRPCKAETAQRRFWAKVQGGDVTACWKWQGTKSGGYGYFTTTDRQECAHRVAYQWLIGPIPEGLQLDHECRNRGCVNPWHLDPVPSVVNVRRGSACRATDEHCANGHPWSPETWVSRGAHLRICRKCAVENTLRSRRRRLEAIAS